MNHVRISDVTVIAFSREEEPQVIEEIAQAKKDDIVWVSLDGTETKYLPPERSLVKNYQSSFLNHMMWEGLLDEQEQIDYITSRAEKFCQTGKQMVIEDYEFREDEPFYDYSR